MNWDAIGAIGEIIGAAAVVVTLLVRVFQLRQNTREVRANTVRSLQEKSIDLFAQGMLTGGRTFKLIRRSALSFIMD